jgi:hypothetical protein
VIGAGATVVKDEPDRHIGAGNPARVIRARFAPEMVAALVQRARRAWPPARIGLAMAARARGDIAALRAPRHAGDAIPLAIAPRLP